METTGGLLRLTIAIVATVLVTGKTGTEVFDTTSFVIKVTGACAFAFFFGAVDGKAIGGIGGVVGIALG